MWNTGYQPWLHKNSVAAIKTATLKKSNFWGAPQNVMSIGRSFHVILHSLSAQYILLYRLKYYQTGIAYSL